MKTAIIIQAPPAGRSRRVRMATVFLLIVVSIALRSYLSLKAPFWRDEAITIFIARLPNSADVIEALSHDGGTPLFYFLLRIWMSLVGTSDVAIRLLPILLSSLAPAALFLAGEKLAGRLVGSLAAVWLLLNPFVLDAGSQVRMYGLVTLFGIITIYGWIRFFEDHTFRNGLVGALGNILLLYTHNVGIVALLTTQFSWLVWAAFAQRRRGLSKTAVLRWLTLQAIIGAAYLPWLPILIRQLSLHVAPWAGPPLISEVFGELRYFFPALPPPLLGSLPLMVFIFLIVFLGLLVFEVFRRPESHWIGPILAIPLGGIVMLAVVSQYKGAFGSRYILPWIPFLALGVFALAKPVAGRARTWAVPCILLISVFHGLAANSALIARPSNAHEISEKLTQSVRSRDEVIVLPYESGAPSVSYYLAATIGEQISFPDQRRVEIIDWANYDDRVRNDQSFRTFLAGLASRAAARKRIWVIGRTYSVDLLRHGDEILPSSFLNLEVSREQATITHLEKIFGRPGIVEIQGCRCSSESYSLLRFE